MCAWYTSREECTSNGSIWLKSVRHKISCALKSATLKYEGKPLWNFAGIKSGKSHNGSWVVIVLGTNLAHFMSFIYKNAGKYALLCAGSLRLVNRI